MYKTTRATHLINLTGEPFNVYDGFGDIVKIEPENPKDWISRIDIADGTFLIVKDEDLPRARELRQRYSCNKKLDLALASKPGKGRGGAIVRHVYTADRQHSPISLVGDIDLVAMLA